MTWWVTKWRRALENLPHQWLVTTESPTGWTFLKWSQGLGPASNVTRDEIEFNAFSAFPLKNTKNLPKVENMTQTGQAECGDCGKVCAINNREMTRYNWAARWAHPDVMPIWYNIIQYHMIPHHTRWYHTIPYAIIQYHMIPYNTIQYNTIQYHRMPYDTITYHTNANTVTIPPSTWYHTNKNSN